MSLNYYLVCHECRQRIHVAQDGVSGWSFYSGEPTCMRRLGAWLADHAMERPAHRFVLHDENALSSGDYAELEWRTQIATAAS